MERKNFLILLSGGIVGACTLPIWTPPTSTIRIAYSEATEAIVRRMSEAVAVAGEITLSSGNPGMWSYLDEYAANMARHINASGWIGCRASSKGPVVTIEGIPWPIKNIRIDHTVVPFSVTAD